jgi:DNA-binding NarL/FixJ family response regulator
MTNVVTPKTPARIPTIVIVDDHPVAREGLVAIIQASRTGNIIAQASNAREALELIDRLEPDIVILDLSLGDRPGLEVIKDIKARKNHTAILVLSMHDEQIYAERCIHAGARGYVMKTQAADEIIHAVTQVFQGRVHVSQAMSSRLLSHLAGSPKGGAKLAFDRLTDRELEVFELLGQGKTTKQIARLLHLSSKTIEAHREHIKDKLDLKSSTELLRLAVLASQSQG